MIPGLEPVALKELLALGQPRVWEVNGNHDELASLTPIRGRVCAEHRGNILEVEGSLQTILCLRCDRCLGHFNQQLTVENSELIWLGSDPSEETFGNGIFDAEAPEGLMECLDPRGSFEPERWVFEQLNLQLPVVNHCGDHCPGPPLQAQTKPIETDAVDPRWAALRRLQQP
jgi:uncharacterized protein